MKVILKQWFATIDLFGLGLTPHCPNDDIAGIANALANKRPKNVSFDELVGGLQDVRDYYRWRIEFRTDQVKRRREDIETIDAAVRREIEWNDEDSVEPLREMQSLMEQALREVVDWARSS